MTIVSYLVGSSVSQPNKTLAAKCVFSAEVVEMLSLFGGESKMLSLFAWGIVV